MKKVLIVNNNLQIGGIQKSLINLLNGIADEYDVTLLLFADYGDLKSRIPQNVKVIYSNPMFRFLGIPWADMKHKPFLSIHKIFVSLLNKVIGKKNTISYLSFFQKKIKGYDTVISFSQCTNEKMLAVCCPEFVLKNTICENKVCFVHCDYPNSETVCEYNNNIYKIFDKIACCSESVKERFLSSIPEVAHKTFVVRNFCDNGIIEMADENPVIYDDECINIVSCARLSKEKGIERAIDALKEINRSDIRYHIIGDGPEKEKLIKKVSDWGMNESVVFYNEQINPYRYMKNADYLLVPSYHEAAPIVFDEARILGLKVISTETTSAKEMLLEEDIIISDLMELKNIKKINNKNVCVKDDLNDMRRLQFEKLI